MNSEDLIIIRGLRVKTHIGVPDEERASAQEILLHVKMEPQKNGNEFIDEIDNTVDYHAVVLRLEAMAADRPRKLIETLAEEMAATILNEFSVSQVTLEIEKYILPQTQSVGVRIMRSKSTDDQR